MKYVKFGGTGLEVSSVILGAMSFGLPASGSHAWTLGPDQARPIVQQALEAGVNAFDTANVYSEGTGEEVLRQALHGLAKREDVVIMTKVFNRMRPGPNGAGLSRVAILREIDASLHRLGTDYVDVYQIHRYDPTVPVEETMEALHDVIKAGKARYIGASSMFAWQFAKAQTTARLNGWTPFVSMQVQYNLIAREEEREMLPLCLDQGVAVMAWSPLARGKLARATDAATTRRSATDAFQARHYKQFESADQHVIDAVRAVAGARGLTPAQVAMAWVAQQQAVTAPLVGVTQARHLDEAVSALDVTLDEAELTSLERGYVPHAPEGF